MVHVGKERKRKEGIEEVIFAQIPKKGKGKETQMVCVPAGDEGYAF